MNIKQIFFLLAFIISPFIFSQNVELPIDYVRMKNHAQNTDSEVIQGSKYLNEEFQQGTIILNDKEINALLRYDLLDDSFELKSATDGEIISVVRSEDVHVEIASERFAMENYSDQEDGASIKYFQILNDGPIRLLKNNIVSYKDAEPAANSYTQAKPAKYVTSTEYYLAADGKPAQKIRRLRKKDVLDLIDTEDARNYVKENNLKLKTEGEVIQLLNFLNESK